MMRLYWAPRTRSLRILWLLEEIGLPYERVTLDIRRGQQADPDFLRLNPMGKVPVLVDGAAVVSESGAIAAYLAERFPEAKLAPPPGDPRRGQYLKWLFFSGNCIEGAFAEKFGNLKLPEVAAGWGSFQRVVDVLEQAVAKDPWLLGETFTAADVMIGADLHFGMTAFQIIEPRPALTAYVGRCTGTAGLGAGRRHRRSRLRAPAQSVWNTSSICAHHSPSLRVSKGSCIGSVIFHQRCVSGSAAIFAMSAAKSLPWYS